jgi:hypothetical protein
MPEPIAYTFTVDGVPLPVYEDARGQYVIDQDGEETRGVWYIPPDETVIPIIVNVRES